MGAAADQLAGWLSSVAGAGAEDAAEHAPETSP
jgi:hypothetical protein